MLVTDLTEHATQGGLVGAGGRGRGREHSVVVTLALVLVVVTVLAAYGLSRGLSSVPTTTQAGMTALAILPAVVALVLALASVRLFRREGARRRRTEKRLARLLQGADQTEDLVTIVNRKGRIEYVNRAVELTTGYSRQELLQKRKGAWFPWYEGDQATADVRDTLLAGRAFHGHVACRRKDGTSFVLQEDVTPLQEGS